MTRFLYSFLRQYSSLITALIIKNYIQILMRKSNKIAYSIQLIIKTQFLTKHNEIYTKRVDF